MSNDHHEKEIIRLSANKPKARRELHEYLKERGFASEDDFYFLDRPDTPKPWQSISVMTVDVFNRGSTVHETEEDIAEYPGQWDELRVDYPLATLPPFLFETCVAECEALAVRFGLQMELGGDFITSGQLRSTLMKIADDLTAELDEPGSETLRILIEQSYSR